MPQRTNGPTRENKSMTQKVLIQESSRFDINAALGNLTQSGKAVPDIKFGFNGAIGAASEGVHSKGGAFNFPQSAQTVRIKAGGDAADDAAGAGAQSVRVIGIDSDLGRAEEVIVTNGISVSTATTKLFWRIFRVVVEGVGTYGAANTGIVTIENTTDGDVLIEIPAGSGQSQSSLISTALKRPIVITGLALEIESTKLVRFDVFKRIGFNDVVEPFSPKRDLLAPIHSTQSRTIPFSGAPIFIPELSDVWVEASIATSSAEVGTVMDYYTVPVL